MPTIANTANEDHSQPPKVMSAKEVQEEANRRNKGADGKGSLILRIKRKRGTEPITALRIETLLSEGIDPSEVEEHAKRMQGGEIAAQDEVSEESTRAKRRLTDRGVFRLAETVSASSFADARATRRLEQRISELKKTPAPAPGPASTPSSPNIPQEDSVPGSTAAQTTHSGLDTPTSTAASSALRFKVIKPPSKDLGRQALLGSLKGKSSSGNLTSRASQFRHNRNASKSSLSSLRKTGDTVVSSGRKSSYPSKLRFIDAVMERAGKARGSSVKKEKSSRITSKKVESKNADTEMDLLDSRFADLLGNYLKENDLQAPSDLYKSTTNHNQKLAPSSDSEESEDEDYVYDIYFREKETRWGSGPAGASDAGLRPAEVAGHEASLTLPGLEVGQKVAAEAQYVTEPMATLVGFDEEDDLMNEMETASRLMAQEVPNDSSDEFDEGEDEDSNDEGFYRNDYPEDEGQEEDEFNQAGWGWSGPRRMRQKANSSDDGDDSEDKDSEGESDDLHD